MNSTSSLCTRTIFGIIDELIVPPPTLRPKPLDVFRNPNNNQLKQLINNMLNRH